MGQTEKIESESKKWKCKNIFQVEADREDQIAVHHFLQVLGATIKIGVGIGIGIVIAFIQKARVSRVKLSETKKLKLASGYMKLWHTGRSSNVKKIDNCLNFQKPQ